MLDWMVVRVGLADEDAAYVEWSGPVIGVDALDADVVV